MPLKRVGSKIKHQNTIDQQKPTAKVMDDDQKTLYGGEREKDIKKVA
jgi:hypothetical protein